MKQNTLALVLSGLLILTFTGCSNPLSDKTVSGGESVVTGDINPQSGDAIDETTIMGKVANISGDIITLSLLTKNEAASEAEIGDSSSSGNSSVSDTRPSSGTSGMQSSGPFSDDGSSSYSPTGDKREIEVTSSADITLKSGKSGILSDIKIGDIINVKMSGYTVKSIKVISNDEESSSDIIAPASNESGLSNSSD
ncbi:hypothetical protein A7X67_04290 [Clostridium sp. W14A]|nr:hypothetical protein A7X67_04290 [Clostridium sp. W14A]